MEPVFLLSGQGETTAETRTRTVWIKGECDDVVVTESRYRTGQHGPDPHIHRRHTDAFWILDGALVFEVGAERRRVRAERGTFVSVPANVVHTFWNEATADAWFLNVHAPGELFAAYLRAMRDGRPNPGFDTEDAPAGSGPRADEVVVRLPGEGETLSFGTAEVTFKLESHDRGGTFSLTETLVLPGFEGPVPHVHEGFFDCFYVLEGALTVRLGDRVAEAPARTFVLVPPGTIHTFSNTGPSPTRILNLMAPGGFEGYLRESVAAAGGGPPDRELMAAIASRHDFHPRP